MEINASGQPLRVPNEYLRMLPLVKKVFQIFFYFVLCLIRGLVIISYFHFDNYLTARQKTKTAEAFSDLS